MNHPNTTAKVLALDLAQTCGHALIANGIISSGSQCFKPSPKIHKLNPGLAFLNFHRWLRLRISDDKPLTIAFEEVYRWSSSAAAHSFNGFRAIMLEECHVHSIKTVGYSPPSIKKFWTGNGRADKEAMVAHTYMRFPDLQLADDNEADAIAILHLHLASKS